MPFSTKGSTQPEGYKVQVLSISDLGRIRQAVAFQSMAFRKQDSAATKSIEKELSSISNILREAQTEADNRGYVTIEVKK